MTGRKIITGPFDKRKVVRDVICDPIGKSAVAGPETVQFDVGRKLDKSSLQLWGYDGFQDIMGGFDGSLNEPTPWKPPNLQRASYNQLFTLVYYVSSEIVRLDIYAAAPNGSQQVDNTDWWTSFSGTSVVNGAFTFTRAGADYFSDSWTYDGGNISRWEWRTIPKASRPWGPEGTTEVITDFTWTP